MKEETLEEVKNEPEVLSNSELLTAPVIRQLRRDYIANTGSSKEAYKAAIYFAIIDKGPSLKNKIPNSAAQEKQLWAWFNTKLSKRRAKNKIAKASRKRNR